MPRRVIFTIVACVVIVLVAIAATVWQGGVWQPAASDALDQFELLQAVPDATSTRYAGIYRYYHANSSSTVMAVWIGQGQPPAVGSRTPVAGDPAMAWTGSADNLRVRWQEGSQKLVAEVDGLADIKSGPEAFEDCYFADPRSTNVACYDDKQVELR